MNAFQDLAEMTRDYGLVRYFVLVTMVVAVLVVILFLWGHVPEEAAPPAVPQAPPAAPTSY